MTAQIPGAKTSIKGGWAKYIYTKTSIKGGWANTFIQRLQ
jgi:hypothetical protein